MKQKLEPIFGGFLAHYPCISQSDHLIYCFRLDRNSDWLTNQNKEYHNISVIGLFSLFCVYFWLILGKNDYISTNIAKNSAIHSNSVFISKIFEISVDEIATN